jgi:hypothetical protein
MAEKLQFGLFAPGGLTIWVIMALVFLEYRG